MASYRGQKPIKFPILKEVEYISIFRNRNSVLEIDGKDVEGLSWRELQLYLGKYLAPGICQYTLKFKKSDVIHSGRIRATIMGVTKAETETNPNDILKEFKSLKDQISKASDKGGVSFDMLLNAQKQGYESQVSFLNQQIKYKDDLIAEIKKEVDELENDLSDCEREQAKSSGIGQWLSVGEKILSMKFGSTTKVSLKDSNTTDIPEKILLVLGVIDWQKIDHESIDRIANSIQQYLSVIPKEFFKGVQQ